MISFQCAFEALPNNNIRNTDRANVYVFAEKDYQRWSIIYHLGSQVIQKYRDKMIRSVYRMSDATRGVEDSKRVKIYTANNGCTRAGKVIYDRKGR